MGKTEAFCTQCGSLITIDDSKDKNKCLFCGTEIATSKALDLKSDPQTRAALQKEAEQKAIEAARAKKELQKQNKGPKPDAAAASAAKQVVVIRPIPMKTKLTMLAIFAGIVLILAGIFVPTILTRNAKRDTISAQLTQKMPFNIQSYAFKYNDNSDFVIATADDVTEATATKAYQNYVELYKAAYSITTEKAQGKVILWIYAKNGLFYCETVKGAMMPRFETATPTPTPTPIVSSAASSATGSSASASK